MLEIKFIRDNQELIKANCQNRRVQVDIDALLAADDQRRKLIQRLETMRALRNQTSKGKPTTEEIQKMRAIGDEVKAAEQALDACEQQYHALMLAVPNLTHPGTPIGGEADFKIVFESQTRPIPFKFEPLTHEELLVKNDLADFERGTKVAGSKFYFFKNNLVRLNLALINYGLDIVAKHGYALMETPDLAKDSILMGTGYNPRGPETQIYSIEGTDLSLVGTAEITMGGYHANEILDLSAGPKKYVALSHCFRTEAGAYGKESKGLYRVHQFTKLEMFVYCLPQDSEKYHQEIVEIEKEILDGLELPYRAIEIPSGDLGGPAYRKFDFEGYMTMKQDNQSQGGYGEVTSCSNCTDFQARRLNIRYRAANGATEFVHTLNGTAVVLSRFPIIIAENYQQPDGTIAVPKVLQKYCGLKKL